MTRRRHYSSYRYSLRPAFMRWGLGYANARTRLVQRLCYSPEGGDAMLLKGVDHRDVRRERLQRHHSHPRSSRVYLNRCVNRSDYSMRRAMNTTNNRYSGYGYCTSTILTFAGIVLRNPAMSFSESPKAGTSWNTNVAVSVKVPDLSYPVALIITVLSR